MNIVVVIEFDFYIDYIWGYRLGLGYIFIYIFDRLYRNFR